MGDYIEVNIQTLEQDVKSLGSTLEQVKTDMKGMFDAVSELDTMWDGPANQAFVQQFERDRQLLLSLCEAVDGIIDSMNEAKDAYRKCESNVGAEISRIKI